MLWFFAGLLLLSPVVVFLEWFLFGIKVWMGAISVVLGFFIAIVACRATGETDTTPIGALGSITQLMYGVLIPQNTVANLMTSSVTGNTATTSADLLTDLKSGYLLGANPRKQFLAQFIGCFVGTLIIVPVFYVIVPTPEALGGDTFPAPSAKVMEKLARLLASGLEALHPSARWGMLIGALIGVALPLLERVLPERTHKYIPSATGLGLAFVIPFFNSLSMFVGALVGWILEKSSPKVADDFLIPVSSGLIAGESILGVVVALIAALS
jgi:OPT family oligopeptide transporter